MTLAETLAQLPYDYEVVIRPKGGSVEYRDLAGYLLEDNGKSIRLEDFDLLTEVHLPGQNGSKPPTEVQVSPTFVARVNTELDTLRVRDTARRRFAQESAPPADLPPILTLRERLAKEIPAVHWRIEGWQPLGTRVLLAAQYKAGKTTLTGNLTRCLVDDQPWLDIAPVTPALTGHVTILDFEMSERQIDSWLRDQGIENDDRVVVIPLRGKATTFDILDDSTRREWADRLSGTEYLIFDCLRPVLDALGLDEHREAGRFLTAFDALCDLADINDALVVHHMGHTGERSRGDSRLRDWPDVEWRLVRQDEDPSSTRYMSAFGRDVDIPEGEIAHEPDTRHMSWQGGSRVSAGTREALEEVLDVLRESEDPLSGRAIESIVHPRSDHSRATIRDAIELGIGSALIHVLPGPRNSKLHHHLSQCASAPECAMARQRTVEVSAPVPIGHGAHSRHLRALENQEDDGALKDPESLLTDQLGATPQDDLPEPW